MTLAEFTRPGLLVPRLRGADVAGVIQELCQSLQREGCVPDLLPFYHAVLNREFLVSTSIEVGIAFPHARLPGLAEVLFAFGRCQSPMIWHSQSATPVSLVFLAAVPATDSTRYLALLSGITRLAADAHLLGQLHAAGDAAEIFAFLNQIPLRSATSPRPRVADKSHSLS